MINVFILTFCRNLDLFYGTELIFKTLRVGFPNARVTVVDNASLPEVRPEIALLARQNDCIFRQLENPGIQHHDFLQGTLRTAADDSKIDGPVVFLDPDICLWDSCEDFSFEGLVAGKAVGKFYCSVTHTITMPRLHTSFLWIPDAGNLQQEIWKIKAAYFDFEPFIPSSFRIDSTWYRFDTGASLYAAIPHTVSYFTEEHFRCYDHLFCGSHLDWIYSLYDKSSQKMMSEIHDNAKAGNLKALKGVWRYQHNVWEKSFPVIP
ncbi:MAG: hypothetical protein AB1442_12385 [Nitrospirota bacterium]